LEAFVKIDGKDSKEKSVLKEIKGVWPNHLELKARRFQLKLLSKFYYLKEDQIRQINEDLDGGLQDAVELEYIPMPSKPTATGLDHNHADNGADNEADNGWQKGKEYLTKQFPQEAAIATGYQTVLFFLVTVYNDEDECSFYHKLCWLIVLGVFLCLPAILTLMNSELRCGSMGTRCKSTGTICARTFVVATFLLMVDLEPFVCFVGEDSIQEIRGIIMVLAFLGAVVHGVVLDRLKQ